MPTLPALRKVYLHCSNTFRVLEEHEWQGVLVFLREFVVHAGDGGAEEEYDEMLVGTTGAVLMRA
ncbi:MAG: hypothetical protein K6E67_06545 [Prevotella sp.]|nr:hypothetical protein [Prevotella sp.]